MILTGTFYRSLDEKGRVAIPKALRDELGAVAFVAPGTDNSLSVYAEDIFVKLGGHFANVSPLAQELRTFSRLFYAQAQRIEMDVQGRARIPAELSKVVGLRREIVLLGVRDHVEIWDRECWESYFSEKIPRYDEIAERAMTGVHPAENRQSLTEEHSISIKPR